MSLRLLTSRLTKHGRLLLQNLWSREIHINILEQKQNRTLQTRLPKAASNVLRSNVANTARNAIQAVANQPSLSTTSVPTAATGIFRFGQHARKIFVDNILNRVTSTYSSDLRQQATKKLFYGDSAPFFALIGVSLASGAGVLTKEDELEGVCWEIREAASRLQTAWNLSDTTPALRDNFSIDDLNVGAPIAKGCAAVVYAAAIKLKEATAKQDVEIPDDEIPTSTLAAAAATSPIACDGLTKRQHIVMTPIQNISRFVHNFGSSVDNLNIYNQRSSTTFSPSVDGYEHEKERENSFEAKLNETVKPLKMEEKEFVDMQTDSLSSNASIERYPLALKMMFNYDIQSNAISILRAMYKETVPARQRHLNATSSGNWERYLQEQTLTLPTHPFIVNMLGFFCDEVRNFPHGHLLYPSAQPQRINPNGYGRNMSLFLLMKRYDFSLRALLDSTELQARTKLLLFAQLLEAVAHLNRHGIAHRDLKSDNILIELNDDGSHPILVLSDFGCCLADKVHGLQLPYTSHDMDKGGNAALMAPEIINKQPGPFAVLNYAKADLWACGAIAYEIFGLPNPFYASNHTRCNVGNGAAGDHQPMALRNDNYKVNDLPPLTNECPELVQQLIFNILNPNPSKRVSPDIAANVMQLCLWAPSKWLKSGGMPNSTEILQWLLSLTTKLMCEGHAAAAATTTANVPPPYNLLYNKTGRRTYVEYLLICSFLARARLRRIRGALSWIQDTV